MGHGDASRNPICKEESLNWHAISIFNIRLEDNTHNMTFNPTIHAFISNNKGNNESSYFNPFELLKESKKKKKKSSNN